MKDSGTARVYCPQCSRHVEVVTVHQASRVIKVSPRTIYHWIADQKVHAFKTAGGQMRLCADSLIRPFEERGSDR